MNHLRLNKGAALLTAGTFLLVGAALITAAALLIVSALVSAEGSAGDEGGDRSAKSVVEHLLKVRGWQLDWHIEEEFDSPSITLGGEYSLGNILRQIFHPHVAANRDVAILVCGGKDKRVIVYRDMLEEDVRYCTRMFNALDF